MKTSIIAKIIAGALVASGGITVVTVAAIKFSKTEDDSQSKAGDTQESQKNISVEANADESQQATGVVNESDGAKTEQIQNTDNEQKNTNSNNSSSNQSQISNEQARVSIIKDTTTVSTNESENNMSNGQTQISATDNENDSKSITVETQLTSVDITESVNSTTGQIKNTNNEQANSNLEIGSVSVIQPQDSTRQTQVEIVQRENLSSTNLNVDNLSNGQAQAETTTTNANSKIKNEDITFFVSSKKLSSTISEELNNNYQCQFKDKDAFDCVVTVPQLDTTLKHSNISKFTQDDENQSTFTKEELKKTNNIYKITIKKSDESKINWTSDLPDGSIAMDLVSKNNANQKFAQFGILFVMKGNKIHEQTKIKDFIFKYSEESSINIDGAAKCECTTTSNSMEKTCYIHRFSDNDDQTNFSSLVLNASFDSVEIEKNKYYWINFTSGLAWSGITNIQIKQNNKNINATNLKKAVYHQSAVSDNTSNFQHLFILEETVE